MEPLEPVAVPTLGVLVTITEANSWPSGSAERPVRLAYVATDSKERLSFASLQSAPERVVRVATRPSYFEDLPYGLVVEVHLADELGAGESVILSLAQAGATTYYPPQQIDDAS